VSEGMQVKRGDMLVTIKPDNYQSALDVARASVDASRASVLNTKAAVEQAFQRYLTDSVNFSRQDELFRKKVISRAEYDAAKLQFDIARSALKGAQANEKAAKYQIESQMASLRSAETDLRKTTLFASMDGTLTRQNIKLGERVVGTSMMAGTEMFRIADLSRMQVLVNINENDIVHVKIGDSAHIEVDAYPSKLFRGSVTEIAYSAVEAGLATAGDQVTSFEVKVEIDPKSYLQDPAIMRGVLPHQSPFRPGMSAQVEIYTDRVENATAVPIQAVTMRRLGTNEKEEPVEVVFVWGSDGKVQLRAVKTGIADESFIEILSGLKPGEKIVTGPYKLLTKDLNAGMKVEVGDPEQEKGNKSGPSE
jgi:HlyD family secretion protein